eukprot:6430397-Amphidinium_carterae.1
MLGSGVWVLELGPQNKNATAIKYVQIPFAPWQSLMASNLWRRLHARGYGPTRFQVPTAAALTHEGFPEALV